MVIPIFNLRFDTFVELDCGTNIEVGYEVSGVTLVKLLDTLCSIDYWQFTKAHNGFIDEYTEGEYGLEYGYDDNNVRNFDIQFSFNDEYTTAQTGRNTIDALAKYVLGFVSGISGAVVKKI